MCLVSGMCIESCSSLDLHIDLAAINIYRSGTVGNFGCLEFNRFCFGRLGRKNPVITELENLLNSEAPLTLIFSSG